MRNKEASLNMYNRDLAKLERCGIRLKKIKELLAL